jgi:hypothetical protein
MFVAFCLLLWTGPFGSGEGPAAASRDRAAKFGFSGMLISRLGDRAHGLRVEDLNGDGRQDVLVINNGKSRIDLLMAGNPEGSGRENDSVSRNDLDDIEYFGQESYPTEEKVVALEVGDLNSDGRPDLVTLGDSSRLVVAHQGSDLSFPSTQSFEVEDGVVSQYALQVGDLNGDGRDDAVVLGKQSTFLFLQEATASSFALRGERVLAHGQSGVNGVDLVDLNGDGHLDLLYWKLESEWPLRYQLNAGGARFGPVVMKRLTAIRAYASGNLDGEGAEEIAVLHRRSGRLSLLQHRVDDAGGSSLPYAGPYLLPLAELKESGERSFVFADVDGDGRADLLVAEPSAARLVVYPGGDHGFGEPRPCPALVGVSHPRVADVDGDGALEVVVAAAEEGTVGIAELQDGVVGFPSPLPIPGDAVVALEVADGDGDGQVEIWTLESRREGRSRSVQIRVFQWPDREVLLHSVEKVKTDPTDLLIGDFNHDQRPDVLVILPKELPRLLLGSETDGALALQEVEAEDLPGFGILEGLPRSALWQGDLDQDGKEELIVPGKNFVRVLHLDAAGVPVVVGQYNLEKTDAEVQTVAAGDLDGDGRVELVLADKSSHSLHVLRAAGSSWELVSEVQLPLELPKQLLIQGSLLVLANKDELGFVEWGEEPRSLVTIAGFEPPYDHSFFSTVTFGDVNGDDANDVVFLDPNHQGLSIAEFDQQQLHHALRFRVFEERLFEKGRAGAEPREVVVGDVTGDGKDDVILLVHDRLIAYPQE